MLKKKNKKKKIEKDKTLEVQDFNSSIERVLEYYLLGEYKNLAKKIFISKFIFYFFQLSTLVMSSLIIIFTMFIIGKKIGGIKIQWIFVVISILTSIITFITNIEGVFTLRKRKEIYSKRIAELKNILEYIDRKFTSNPNVERVVIRTTEKLEELENSEQID